MKITGIIAEYNPFHNGHAYHIKKAKEVTGADKVIVVMSGDFVQRGAPAILPKHLRAKAALDAGADLVIELPVCYACASAEFFALGSVSLLNNLECVDSLCFGSECGDITHLKQLAHILAEEPELYKRCLQEHLRQGYAFPAARQNALKEYLKDVSFSHILEHPNNTLGIEYLKAIARLQSNIKPYTIQREGAGYHTDTLHNQFSSASAVRAALQTTSDLDVIAGHIPNTFFASLQEHYRSRFPICADDFSLLLKYRLLQETNASLVQYADISEELANRIIKNRNAFLSFSQFCTILKTKELTYTRISRALMHLLLNIKKRDIPFWQKGHHEYIRILGFRTESTELLTLIKQQAKLPLLTKLTTANTLSLSGKTMLAMDVYAADLYESVVTDKFQTPFQNEYQHQIIRV